MSRIRANTAALSVSFFGTAALYFLQLKIVTINLEQKEVGIWATLVAMGALLGVLTELGLPQVILRYAAKFDAEGRILRTRSVVAFSLRAHYVALAVMALVLAFAGTTLWGLFSGEPLEGRLIVLGYLAVASGSLRAINNASFRGLRRMGWVAGLEIGFSALVTLGYYILRRELTVELILLVFLAASVVIGALGLVVSWGLIRRLGPTSHEERAPVFPEIRGFWSGAAAAGIFLIAIEWVDKLLLAGLASLSTVAVFQVVSRLALFPRRLLAVPMQVLYPEITHKWEAGRGSELVRDMALFIKLELVLGLLLIVPLTLFAKPLIRIVSTDEFLSGAPALWVFTAVIPLLCLHQPLVLFLRAVGHVWLAFTADATWLLVYLGLGSLLVRPFGLAGFVAGQVVASIWVLAYTLWVFRARRFPAPHAPFFLKSAGVSALIWGASALGGTFVPAELGPVVLFLLGICVAILANLLIVLGGFLSREEEARAVAMLAGRGRLGRLAGFFFAWPRRMRGPAGAVVLMLAAALGAAGCTTDQPPCLVDDEIPQKTRRELTAAADRFFGQIRAEDAAGIFRDAVSLVRKENTLEEFVTPIARAVHRHGMPEALSLEHVYYVNFRPGMPIPSPVPCVMDEDGRTDRLRLIREPIQGAMVHSGVSKGERLQISTLWFQQEDEWRLASFMAKPMTVQGKDANQWTAVADEQRLAGNQRNAAILYNLVLDLFVPNPWTDPDGAADIQLRQKSITVTHLPGDRLDLWEAESDTFRVYSVGYRYLDGSLDVLMSRETDYAYEDSLLIFDENRRLFEYARERFPEYAEVFGGLAVRATPPGRSDVPGFTRRYPLRETP